MSDTKNSGMTKADVIILKLDKFAQQQASFEARVNAALRNAAAGSGNDEVVKKLEEENQIIRQEMHFLSAQLESVYNTLSKTLQKLSDEVAKVKTSGGNMDVDELSSRVAAKIVIPETAQADVDEDSIAEKVANRIPARPYSVGGASDIDYDALGFSVAKNIYVPQAIAEEIDYDELASKVASKLPSYQNLSVASVPAVQAEVDYDLLAQKVAEAVGVSEVISPDYVAAKVAEQIIIPSSSASDLDIEELSRKVADKIAIPAYDAPVTVDEERLAYAVAEKLKEEQPEAQPVAEIDEQALAQDIASRLNFSLSDELIADAVVKNLAGAIDSDEIADCVAKRVGSISPEQFEVTVDDDGCDSLADALESKLDYDVISAAVAEKLAPAFLSRPEEIDPEELAKQISDKLSVNANLNEDAIADKAAAVLSNYLPEIDEDAIADKVVAGVIPALPQPAPVDSDGIAGSVADKLLEAQEDSDYDIVIDDEGLARITENVSAQIKEETDVRFNKLEEDVAELKRLLLSGVVVAAAANEETAVTQTVTEEVPAEETLITVSDLVGDVEEEAEEDDGDSLVDDLDETLVDGEIMPDGIDAASGGVDFANMMKYNRSFIARIIQGTDDQKNYYGAVKTALLSYKKVNSNIAWGAERFNKGRETIARFKIRGKTLCLYLALDPNEFATSVYHQADVSDNKSMHGTPMMVKIKSPLGVKKAIRLIDEMLARRDGEKRNVPERDYAAMYPYETMEELIEDGLVKDVSKK